jgi:serine protease Do
MSDSNKTNKSSSNGFLILGFVGGFLILLIFLVTFGLIALVFSRNEKIGNESGNLNLPQVLREVSEIKVIDEQSAVIDVVSKSDGSVVSIVGTKDLGNIDRFFRRQTSSKADQKQTVGAGTGFIVSKEGYILTNRHVVDDSSADYTVVFSDEEIYPVKVLARDTVLDIAILKVDIQNRDLKALSFGDSDSIKVGQTAIAIGNSLGEFNNSVSKGIISGLARTITAADEVTGSSEILDDIIQTDASINPGNSGGPLLDINGNVIGINVAKAQSAENIGFAIPINNIKPILESVITKGKIERPYLGIRYLDITSELAKEKNLKYDYGAYLSGDETGSAVASNSPAGKISLKEGDIILEIENNKITLQETLKKQLQKYKVGQEITLKIYKDEKEQDVKIKLENNPQFNN